MEKLNLTNYYTVQDNELMDYLNIKPVEYIIGAQFRNTVSGEMRLFERKVLNKKYFTGEELEKFLHEKLKVFIQEKESGFIYNFIPYERAVYIFPAKGKKTTWQAKCFYDEKEKEAHQFFLNLAREKAELELKRQGVL